MLSYYYLPSSGVEILHSLYHTLKRGHTGRVRLQGEFTRRLGSLLYFKNTVS